MAHIAGIGGGVEGVILAEVTRTSVEEKRTGIISILISIRQTGLLIGKFQCTKTDSVLKFMMPENFAVTQLKFTQKA